MDIKNIPFIARLGYFMVGAGLGTMIGLYSQKVERYKPVQVQEAIINPEGKDLRKDVIIKNGWGETYVFFRQDDGTFLNAREHYTKKYNALTEKYEEDLLENQRRLSELEHKAKELK